MDALIIENDEVKGIETNTGQTLLGPVILATGHSARDVYRWLAANQVEIEAKGIAVGVRLEHPAELIDRIQYHSRDGRGKYLPAAEYSFVTQVDGRGVYSFLHVPRRFCGSGSQRPPPNRCQRHEPQQPRLPLEQFGNGSGTAPGGLGQ